MRRLLDFAIYILIGILVVVIGYWLALRDISEDSLVRWGGLSLNTAALFGWVIKQNRRFWRKRAFWATILILFLTHTAIFYVILRIAPQWRMAWFFLLCTAEVIPISLVLNNLMQRARARTNSNAAN